jgi:hypothetical protein
MTSRKVQKNEPQILYKILDFGNRSHMRDTGFFVCDPDLEVRTMNKGFIR